MHAGMFLITTIWLALLIACDNKPEIAPLTDCPGRARLVGAFPPLGYGQRCEKSKGSRHGPSRFWHKNGQRSADTEWWDGRKHGKFTLWYPNGQKRAEGQHDRMEPAGIWKYWDEKGELVQQKDFDKVATPSDESS